MAVTHTIAVVRDQCFQEIEKLTNSHSLRGSESLCRLLHYLAEHSLANPPSTVKEYQIATEVFGRPSQFDPQSDSTVRVQAGRLRVKLAEYYATEGVDDHVVVKLPKGSYLLSFESKTADPQHLTSEHSLVPVQPLREPVREKDGAHAAAPWRKATIALTCALLIALVAVGALLRSGRQADTTTAASGALRTLWTPFLSGPEEPLVIFSNAAFVGRPETGLR